MEAELIIQPPIVPLLTVRVSALMLPAVTKVAFKASTFRRAVSIVPAVICEAVSVPV